MTYKSRSNFINTLQRELLTSAQAAELLEVTQEKFELIIQNKNLEPIHQSDQGNLYLKREIKQLKTPSHPTLFKKNPIFFEQDATTSKAIEAFDDNIHLMDEITHIFVYLHALDAILDGFYIPLENTLSDKQTMDAPHFVIRDRLGNEMWFTGLNCGYRGTGPSGSSKIIQRIGISEQLAERVREHHEIVKYFKKENGKFEIHTKQSNIKKVTDYGIQCRYWNGKLIFLQEQDSHLRIDYKSAEFIEEYISLVPNIKDFIKDEARKKGYCNDNFLSNEVVYQVIIRDEFNRELWLCPLTSESLEPLKYQKNVHEILTFCGIHIEQPIETFPQSIKRMLGFIPPIKSYEILKSEN
ncbi:hypothetical protein [Bacillus cereus]|uniref:Uncharacterized protein n=1 Tax=Bacillus cereus TaxID=1396 RepID=A0AA44QBW2_BACCE|nr:hypothetical protein [Bacillus cereus]PFN04195.1 hypothetical protein COJ55_22550 [Bacillus cereus]PFS02563.1 hypothetical protein COK38_09260 [Bacillus cereus]